MKIKILYSYFYFNWVVFKIILTKDFLSYCYKTNAYVLEKYKSPNVTAFEVKIKQFHFQKYVVQGLETHLAMSRHSKQFGSPKHWIP